MKLDRRWWVAIGVAVIAAVALVLSYTVFDRPSEECRPVKDLLDFNRSQAEHIASKTGDEQGIPTAAEDAAYQAWADGLAERARKSLALTWLARVRRSPASPTSSSESSRCALKRSRGLPARPRRRARSR